MGRIMAKLKLSNNTDRDIAVRGLISTEEVVDPKLRELRVHPESPDVPLLDLMHVA